jgi:hypothetical protein
MGGTDRLRRGGQNGPVETSGKHAGKRRAEPAPQASASGSGESSGRPWAKLLPLAVGVTLSVVAWGYLVYAAIDFGATARGGETRAWWFLAMASLGAVVCLFVGLLLVARLMRLVGVTKTSDAEPLPPRPIGGKRAAR